MFQRQLSLLQVGFVAGTIFQGTGEVALEMEEKTGDYNTALLSVGAGTLVSILDEIGAGKIINKKNLVKWALVSLYKNYC